MKSQVLKVRRRFHCPSLETSLTISDVVSGIY